VSTNTQFRDDLNFQKASGPMPFLVSDLDRRIIPLQRAVAALAGVGAERLANAKTH
jgi:hypothetical protein